MKASDTRILTTHAGSLPRPRALIDALAAKAAGEAVDPALLEARILTATQQAVARQVDSGIDIGNDGEQGRESFFTYVRERMTGFGGASPPRVFADMVRYPGFLERLMRSHFDGSNVSLIAPPEAIGPIAYAAPQVVAAECARFAGVLAARRAAGEGVFAEAFMTAPSPGIVAAAMRNAHYPDMASYVAALGAALRTEYRAIVDAGFLLQIDAPDLAMERHTLFNDRPLADFLAFARIVVDAINLALEGIPRERVRLHVCWGNYEGPHDLDVALEDIWPEIARARAGALLISMANPRHAHEWRCFKDHRLPDGALLVAGVIDTTTNYVEHPLTVADRIERVAEAVGDPRRVLAGTDCGFETSAGFGPVVEEIVWAKLSALSEGAAIASGRLFG
jgi:5-methyltetrahydropteroyltriglutamate--homocysteine methyltransferase